MEITQQVRDYAAKLHVAEQEAIQIGLDQKAREFAAGGGKVYAPGT